MAIYTFPPALMRVSNARFSLETFQTNSAVNAFNPLFSTSGPLTEFWRAQLSFVPKNTADFRDFRALLRKLRGQKNRFRLYDPAGTLQGTGGATSTINIKTAALAGATSITLKTLVASQTVALAGDDYLEIGGNLYAVDDDAASDGSGEATVTILPPLRKAVAANDPVNTLNPTGTFALMSGAGELTLNVGGASAPVTLSFGEVPDYV
jgi:hypothetical protein